MKLNPHKKTPFHKNKWIRINKKIEGKIWGSMIAEIIIIAKWVAMYKIMMINIIDS
jgi:hypothetical protein